MIAARYLKGWFIIDLLATFPSDYIVKGLEVCNKSVVVATQHFMENNRMNMSSCPATSARLSSPWLDLTLQSGNKALQWLTVSNLCLAGHMGLLLQERLLYSAEDGHSSQYYCPPAHHAYLPYHLDLQELQCSVCPHHHWQAAGEMPVVRTFCRMAQALTWK